MPKPVTSSGPTHACSSKPDPEAFQRLRAAYERALCEVQWALEEAAWAETEDEEALEDAAMPAAGDESAPIAASALEPNRPAAATEHSAELLLPPATSASSAPQPPSAEDLAQQLCAQLEQAGEAAAIATLETLLQGEELLSLDLRDEFQSAVLWRLAERTAAPQTLILRLVDAFGWDDPRHPVADNPAVSAALKVRNLETARHYLQALAHGQHADAASFGRRAARMLLMPEGFQRACAWRLLRDAPRSQALFAALRARLGHHWTQLLSPSELQTLMVPRDPRFASPQPQPVTESVKTTAVVLGLLLSFGLPIAFFTLSPWLLPGAEEASGLPSGPYAVALFLGLFFAGLFLGFKMLMQPLADAAPWLTAQQTRLMQFHQGPQGAKTLLILALVSTAAVASHGADVYLRFDLCVFALMAWLWAMRFGGLKAVAAVLLIAAFWWITCLIGLDALGNAKERSFVLPLLLAVHLSSMLLCFLISRNVENRRACYIVIFSGFASLFPAIVLIRMMGR